MLQLSQKTKIKVVLVADADCDSARMGWQDLDLMNAAMSEIFDPKHERRCVKKRPLVPRRVLPVMARPREHRAAPRREGGARAGSDGPGGSSDPPLQHLKSDYGPRAEANPPRTPRSRAPRVQYGRAR